MRGSIRSIVFAAAIAASVSAVPASAQRASWFQRADRNDDARVTWTEFQNVQPSYNEMGLGFNGRYSWVGRPWNRSFAAQLDLNRDGRISRAEYSSRLRREFLRYDRNGDGAATYREVFGADREEKPRDAKRDDKRSDDRRDHARDSR
jgi:EF hand